MDGTTLLARGFVH